ncbi:protein NRT1/ PTR FAMILY 8.3-like [Silene latifolia]|uniref:protein NRT1/ PTR FAMILY 8.3-like n=1 Tax=Silene latifolia TaxID=37657 RepID=UPI003D784BC5
MSTDDEQILLLEDILLQKGSSTSGEYTGDGSLDFHGRAVLKAETGNWKACLFILGCECCERLAFYGIDTNMVNYLTGKLHQGNVSAARIVTTWSGTCSLTPLLGAFLADAYWGRYWTIAVSSMVYFIGMCILILSASLPALKPAECVDSSCPPTSRGLYALFFAGLYLMALGTGGIKPCASPFGADQFDDTDPIERVKKGSFFNWLFFSISIGSLLASTLIVWIQENVGWSIGFMIPALFMGIAVVSFLSGTRLYRFQKPGGSPFTRIYQDVIASIRKVTLEVPNGSEKNNLAVEGSLKTEHVQSLKYLDIVAVPSDAQTSVEDMSNSRISFNVAEVKQLTIMLRMFPIWITGIVYSAVYSQASTIFVEQGMVMNRSIGSFTIPAASLSMFIMISIIFWVPIYDKFLMPLAKKFTGTEKSVSELRRIGIGFFLSILPMLCAALVEMRQLQLVVELGIVGESVDAPMSICWQTPQYLLMGFCDTITFVGKLEFFYDQSPDNMRSLSTALCLLNTSRGSYLNSLILTTVTAITTSGESLGWIPDDLNKGQLHKYFLITTLYFYPNNGSCCDLDSFYPIFAVIL